MARVMTKGRSCGVVAFLRHFCSDLGAMDGIFEPAKSEKSGEGEILPLCTAGGTGSDGITSVMGGAWLPHLRDFLGIFDAKFVSGDV